VGQGYKVRTAVPGDIDDIVELHRYSIVPVWEERGFSYSLDAVGELVTEMMEEEGQHMLVVELDGANGREETTSKDGSIIGFLWSQLFHDSVSGKIVDEVRMLLVHNEHRSEGIGSKLMEMEEDHARSNGAGNIKLEVMSYNQRAVDFYHKEGFIELKRVMFKGV